MVVAGWGLWQICFHLYLVQVDVAGHIASADAFWRGLYHRFDDGHFLGAVHGLFYPPLEDLLLGAVHAVVRDWQLAYQLYVGALWLAYVGAGIRLALRLGRPLASATVLLALAWFMSSYKAVSSLQGLALIDVVVVGLSGQVLAAVFLLLVLTELTAERPRGWVLATAGSLTVLSHLVMGLVLALVFAAGWLARRDRLFLRAGLWITGATALFWLPFLVHRSSLTSSAIVAQAPWASLGLAVVLLVIARKDRAAWPLLGAGLLIALLLCVAAVVDPLGQRLPVFHYYRLASPGLLLLVTGGGMVLAQQRGRLLQGVVAVSILAAVVLQLPPPGLPYRQPSPARLGQLNWDRQRPFARQLTFEYARAPDFGMDSLASLAEPDYRAVKGLYWESSRNNTLLSSFLAQLYGAPVVLDFAPPVELSCAQQACVFETFARDYNIGRFALDASFKGSNMYPLPQRCYRLAVQAGAIGHLALVPVGSMGEGPLDYTIFQLEPRALAPDLGAAQAVQPADLLPLDRATRYPYQPVWADLMSACKRTGRPTPHLFVNAPELRDAAPVLASATGSARSVQLIKERPGRYRLEVDADTDVAVWIKLSRLPGLHLVDAAGRELPLLDAFPGMVTVMHGTAWLESRRPTAAWVGYALSLATVLAALWLAWRRRVSARSAGSAG